MMAKAKPSAGFPTIGFRVAVCGCSMVFLVQFTGRLTMGKVTKIVLGPHERSKVTELVPLLADGTGRYDW